MHKVCLKKASTTDTELIHILEVCHYWLGQEILDTETAKCYCCLYACPVHDTVLVSSAQCDWKEPRQAQTLVQYVIFLLVRDWKRMYKTKSNCIFLEREKGSIISCHSLIRSYQVVERLKIQSPTLPL